MSKVTVRVTGVDQAVKRLQNRIASYPSYFAAVIKAETNVGADTARGYFAGGGESPVMCSSGDVAVEGTFIHGAVNADGSAVVFLEFGAGDLAGAYEGREQMAEFEMNSGIEVRPGSYSEANDGEYAKTRQKTGQGQWHFGGRVYTEIAPRRGMYHAAQIMKADLSNPSSAAYTSNEGILGGK